MVQVAGLAVRDAWVVTPDVFADDRGAFTEWFRTDRLREAIGRDFEVAQANHSVSHRGVLRGLHFADVPPGQAKLVYCPSGAALDVVVDIRVGSPTFGRAEAVVLDDVDRRAVFISEGLGHAFCALRDDTSVTYLLSTAYDPSVEHAVAATDPALALPWPTDLGELILSPRDRAAPTLAAAAEQGLLPSYDDCRARYAAQR